MKIAAPQAAGNVGNVGLNRRYPGPRPFDDKEIDEHLFFGRDVEIAALTNRIQARRTLVLFGRSGLGKTSLIQAGLYPALRRLGYLPISIRLNNPETGLLDTVQHALKQAAERYKVDVETRESPSLWHLLKQTDFWQGDQLLIPLLVFDQFEEVFTLHEPAFRTSLAKELKELAGDAIPASVRQARARGEKLEYSLQPPELRLLFSLREEYVGSLEGFITEIPTLLDHRYQLEPLHDEQARLAITQPAAYEDPDSPDIFATGPFEYDPAALQLIMQQLTSRRGEIEPFQLQLVCQHAETRVIAHRSDKNEPVRVDTDFLGGSKALEKVRGNFYRKALKEVSGWRQRRRARRLCERLLNAEDRRISIDEYTVNRKLHVRPSSLGSLEESRLIRKDSRPGLDGFYYELSHDSVAQAVTKSRRTRRFIRRAILGVGLLAFGAYSVQQYREVIFQTQTADNRLDDYAAVVRELFNESGALLPELVRIEPGCFMMGSKKGNNNELPVHKVCIQQAFHLGKYEITFDEYDRFAVQTGRKLPDDSGWRRGKRPVIDVSWQDAREFAAWLSEESGTDCRLPTEAEWEYAARAGTANEYAIPAPEGSDNIRDKGLANCNGCGSEWDNKQTATVGSFGPNAWGLYDMHGNVWEWTADYWHDNYNKAPTDGSVWLAGDDSKSRVSRGGSWLYFPINAGASFRHEDDPVNTNADLGFRVVCSSPISH